MIGNGKGDASCLASFKNIVAILGRLMLCTIFLLAALANDITNFQRTAGYMASEGVPTPQVMHAGAIVFRIAGSLSIILGSQARIGVALLVFLVLATYFVPRPLDRERPHTQTGPDEPFHEEPRQDGGDAPDRRQWDGADEPRLGASLGGTARRSADRLNAGRRRHPGGGAEGGKGQAATGGSLWRPPGCVNMWGIRGPAPPAPGTLRQDKADLISGSSPL